MDLKLDRNYIVSIIDELWNKPSGAAGAMSTLKSKYSTIYNLFKNNLIKNHFGMTVYMYYHDIEIIPKCICGKDVKYISYKCGFAGYCSPKCSANDPDMIRKKQLTCIDRYKVSHFSKTLEYKEKFKDTMQFKYGVDNPGQIEQNKLLRSKKKSNTYLNNLIEKYQSLYTPMFTVSEFEGVHTESLWLCKKCNKTFVQSNLAYKDLKCSFCFKPQSYQTSKQELCLYNDVKLLDDSAIHKDRTILQKKELDIFIPNKNLAIEYCGSYWHSDKFLDKKYHYNKFIECENLGIQLLTLFDFDCKKSQIISSMIKNHLHTGLKREYARNGTIQQISSSTSKEFTENFHIRGHAAASFHYGFFIDNELLAVSSWSRSRFKKDNSILELVRLCSKVPITGLLGKFTKFVFNEISGINSIISYVDLRYGSGSSYLKSNYKLIHTTSPGYWYVDPSGKCWHRSKFMKKNLINFPSYDVNKTEVEIMNETAYNRIWDCGHRLFEWKK